MRKSGLFSQSWIVGRIIITIAMMIIIVIIVTENSPTVCRFYFDDVAVVGKSGFLQKECILRKFYLLYFFLVKHEIFRCGKLSYVLITLVNFRACGIRLENIRHNFGCHINFRAFGNQFISAIFSFNKLREFCDGFSLE